MISAKSRTIAVILAGFCAFLPVYATQPILPLLRTLFGVSEVVVSLTVTATTLGIALTAPAIGRWSDHWGRKRTIVWSAAWLALATLFAAAAQNLTVFLFWRFIQGVFTPGVFAVTVAYIHDEWTKSETGHATGAYVGGTVVGGFLGRFLAGFIATHMNWRISFVVLAAIGFAGALLIAKLLPREQPHAVQPTGHSFLEAAREHFANRRLAAAYAVGFCVLFSLTSTFTYINFYLADAPFHLRPASLGSLFFVYLVGAIIAPISGRYIDRFGHKAVLASAIACGAAGVLITLYPSLVAVVLGLMLCSSGVFVAQASSNSFVGLAANHNRALAVGLYVTSYNLGGSAGAALPGFIWRIYHWPGCVFLIVAIQLLTITLALNLWDAPKGFHTDDADMELG